MTVPRIVLLAAALFISQAAYTQSKSVFKLVYSRIPASVMKEHDDASIVGQTVKGEEMFLLRPAYCFITDSSKVEKFKVRLGNGTVGYVYSKYCSFDKEEACKLPDLREHKAVKNSFKGGEAAGCDFTPREKPLIPGKTMPRACYSLYITCSPSLLNNIDGYIALAKRTKINCFVIDIKEDGAPGFKANAMKKYAPSAYNRAGNNTELYRNVVRKCHENGIWAVARIVTFKDYHFTKDHPECALWDKNTNTMLFHNKSNWPSAYSRLVWEYNTALGVEAIQELGFDEVNFDYVRFPDRMTKIEGSIEMRNKYNESKVQAIQRFVQYATDEIHKAGGYVSIDVFGESANPGYTTAYGQYWPAISNVADVICGMPYPDHFSNGYYGIQKPWNHPYEILHAWGTRVQDRQRMTPTPAIVRTWVQAYHVMRFVDRNGIDYDAQNIEKEIRGLYDSGCTGGFTTWLATCSLARYESQAPAFNIDYYSEWLEKQSASTPSEEK